VYFCPGQGEDGTRNGGADERKGEASMKSYPVGRLDEFAEGSRKVVSCDGTEIGVFKIDGELVAWYNQCSHRQGPVCQGRIYQRVIEPVDAMQRTRMLAFDENETHIVCPWHGYEFSLKTGRHPGSSTHRLRAAKLEIVDGEVRVVV
jgi:nitrite reductase/ring-hydroxylating ferredoxin subunit